MRIPSQILIIPLLSVVSAGFLGVAPAPTPAATPDVPAVENDDISMVLRLYTPDQMAAFYEARGFPRGAIERLRQTCFVMAHIENRGKRIVWLELKNWHFLSGQGEIRRLDRNYWDTVWDEVKLPPASRATFGWTQLPEGRDLQPGEPVGGNLILTATDEPFTLQADFLTGGDKRAGIISARFENLRCATDQGMP
jgi:hypothetical protein